MGGSGCVGVLSVVVELAEVGSLMMKDDRLEDIGLWPEEGDSDWLFCLPWPCLLWFLYIFLKYF